MYALLLCCGVIVDSRQVTLGFRLYRGFLAPGERSEFNAPFRDFFPGSTCRPILCGGVIADSRQVTSAFR